MASAVVTPGIPDHAMTTSVLTPDGAVAHGMIYTAGDVDWWRVQLTAGFGYTFRMNADTSSTVDSYLQLLDSAGKELSSDDDSGGGHNALITFTATTSGSYYVAASAVRSDTGAYTLSATSFREIPGDATTTSVLTPDGTVAHSSIYIAGDVNWWRIQLTAGRTYTFRMNADAGSAVDSYLRLLDSAGKELSSDDDSGGGTNALITFTVDTSGTYYVAASAVGSDTGAYTLSATSTIDATANHGPTGTVTIAGAPVAGQTLSAANTLADANGLGAITYDWQASTDGVHWNDLATGSTLSLSDQQAGMQIRVQATYVDGLGTAESVASTATAAVSRVLTGTPGNDTLYGSLGNDVIDGGGGTDTVVYAGNRNAFNVTHYADGSFTVADNSGAKGKDTLINVEKLRFNDQTLNLVKLTDSASNSGDVIGAYFSMFGRAPEPSGLQYWQGQLGTSFASLGKMIDAWLTLDVVKTNGYPDGQSIDSFIAAIYQNVFNKAPDDGGYWKGRSASMSRGDLVASMLAAANAVPAGAAGKSYIDAKIVAATAIVNTQYAYGKDMTAADLTNLLKEVGATNATVQTAENDLTHVLGTNYGVAGLVGVSTFIDTWLT